MPVSGAPSLGSNPYVSAAASAGSAAASLANALAAAHDQQLRLQQQQQQQAAAAMLEQQNKRAELLSKGAKPFQEFLTQRDASGMIQRVPNPAVAGMDKSRVMHFSALGPDADVFIPDEAELEEDKEKARQKVNGKNSVSLNDSLAQEGQTAGYNVQPGQEYAPGVLGELNAAVREHNQQQKGSPEIDTEHFTRDGKPVIVRIDKDRGTYRELKPETDSDATLQGRLAGASGAAQSSAQAAAGNGNAGDGTESIFPWAAPSQTAPRPGTQPNSSSYPGIRSGQSSAAGSTKPGLQFTPKPAAKEPRIETAENANGDKTITAFDAATGKQLWQQVQKGVGKPSDTDERFRERQQDRQDARDARQQERADKVQDAAKTRHDKLRSQEQDQWDLQTAYGDLADASKNKDGEFVPEPRYNASTGEMSIGQDVQITPKRRKAYAALAEQAKTKAQGFAKQSADIRKKFGWGEFSTPAQSTPAAPAAAKSAAAPAQATPKAKASDVVAWAKANGKDPKDALARAKQRGILQ